MFKLHSDFSPAGDQPQAIDKLTNGLRQNKKFQTLLGVTGSGKTFTMANVIANFHKPTLVVSHNKTLAAQLYQEYRDFFPDNAVSYFVSYYDYYQPEAYIPQTDTYIEKETDINDLIDKLRLEATTNLLTRKDVIVVASVSCIYNLGAPSEYERNILKLKIHDRIHLREILIQLTKLQYSRVAANLERGTFRVRGDAIDIWPAYEDHALRIFVDEGKIIGLDWIDPISSSRLTPVTSAVIFPAKHYLTNPDIYQKAFAEIRKDLKNQVEKLEKAGKILEAHRLAQKVTYDLEMLQEVGYVNGIENYSRYFDGRHPGEKPHTLLDYFRACDPHFLTIIDESHMSVPQIGGMYEGDKSRKQTLINYGFRLPAALDNRPLKFNEFLNSINQTIFTSATPAEWEINQATTDHRLLTTEKKAVVGSLPAGLPAGKAGEAGRLAVDGIVEQLIRPTGLIDPEIEVRPAQNQIPDLVIEILKRKKLGQRVLVTTLTKQTAETLAEYLNDSEKLLKIINEYYKNNKASAKLTNFTGGVTLVGDPRRPPAACAIKAAEARTSDGGNKRQDPDDNNLPTVAYLHSDIHTLDRQDILDKLRKGEFDVLVGINLLREGLDLPEVSLVAILDADQEGFLRSKTSLVQTMGRAARHVDGKVILYAYKITKSMQSAIDEVNRRRKIQSEYNIQHHIFPKSITKQIRAKLVERPEEENKNLNLPASISKKYHAASLDEIEINSLLPDDKKQLIRHLTRQMLIAADQLNFELAAKLRDKINEIKTNILGA